MENIKRIAILGGGPSGLFMFKRLVESGSSDLEIEIFERRKKLGEGMPYSADGAGDEHVTNVSSNEIPELVTSLDEWISTVPKDTLDKYHLDRERFNEYKVLPRLLFGQYLSAQFSLLQKQARVKRIPYLIHYNCEVTDLIDRPETGTTTVVTNNNQNYEFEHVVICTGHNWPKKHEGEVKGYFDSPYPPVKLAMQLNHPVAIKGSSLTAVDAIRTLSRHNGDFNRDSDGSVSYRLKEGSAEFKMIMHSRSGMLPAVRFHLEDSHLDNDELLTKEQIATHIKFNDGFLSLDYIFEQDFKLPIKTRQPEFYEKIKDMDLESFVSAMMEIRERLDPFQLLKAEYIEAETSIKRRESVYWKEMLGVLSFAINYPAKYLSAEDMVRLRTSLSMLISIVIAYIPQSSAQEIMALHQAGVLELVPVGDDSRVVAHQEGGIIYHYIVDQQQHNNYFNTYVNCVGQPHLDFQDFPFKTLIANKTVSPARLKFRSADRAKHDLERGLPVTLSSSGDYYLKVSGIAINDYFQVVDEYGAINPRIYMMAVPYIGGYNPDFSGLDFSEAASGAIMSRLLEYWQSVNT